MFFLFLNLPLGFTCEAFLCVALLFICDPLTRFCICLTVSSYAQANGMIPVKFQPNGFVCCRTLRGHTGKVHIGGSIY